MITAVSSSPSSSPSVDSAFGRRRASGNESRSAIQCAVIVPPLDSVCGRISGGRWSGDVTKCLAVMGRG